MSTPLDRAADVLRRELQDYISGFDGDDWDRFSYRLASDVLGHARLPEELNVASEARTANLLALHQALSSTLRYHPGNEPFKANQRTEAEMAQILVEVDKRLGRG